MAKKKTYYIPTIEIVSVRTSEMMEFDMGGSGTHAQAPQHRVGMEKGTKAF